MINKDKCFYLGSITKTHGVKGSVLLWLKDIKAEDIKNKGSVFVEIDGLLVPFFLEVFQIHAHNSIILKFEGIDSELKARSFAGKQVFVSNDQIRQRKNTINEWPDLKSFKVMDQRKGFIGIAVDIKDISNNPLLEVVNKGKTFLIPLHEDIIIGVNKKTREINVDLPDGLLSI